MRGFGNMAMAMRKESPGTAFSAAMLENATQAAADNFQIYIRHRADVFEKDANVLFGPNLDGSYFYRVESRKNDEENALLPRRSDLPKEFIDLFFIANLRGRMASGQSRGQLLVPKHFPGGGPLEATERTEMVISSVEFGVDFSSVGKWLATSPFVLADKTEKIGAMMTSHACYPKLEESVSLEYPDISGILPAGERTPATFSPYIIEGLLRRKLGFGGLIVSDWVEMGSLDSFCSSKKMLENPMMSELYLIYTSRVRKMRESHRSEQEIAMEKNAYDGAVRFVLAANAGVNMVGGTETLGNFYGYVEELCKKSPQFRKILDRMALETLFVKAKLMPKGTLPKALEECAGALEFSDLRKGKNELSREKYEALQTLAKFVEGFSDYAKIRLMNVKSYQGLPTENFASDALFSGLERRNAFLAMEKFYGSHTDVYNKGGLLVVMFRKLVVEGVTGRKWEDMPSNPQLEGEWLQKLMSDPEFRAAYDAIDWNGPGMRKAYAMALQKMSA
jgi:hypothetical protein